MNQHSIGNFGIYIQPILEAQLSYINLLNSNMQKYKISAFQVNYNHYTCTMTSDVNEYMTQFLIAQQDSEDDIYSSMCVWCCPSVSILCSSHCLLKSSHHFTLSIHINFVCHRFPFSAFLLLFPFSLLCSS